MPISPVRRATLPANIQPMTAVNPRQTARQSRSMVYDAKHDLVLLVLGSRGDAGRAVAFATR
jgi:hypothetical protein